MRCHQDLDYFRCGTSSSGWDGGLLSPAAGSPDSWANQIESNLTPPCIHVPPLGVLAPRRHILSPGEDIRQSCWPWDSDYVHACRLADALGFLRLSPSSIFESQYSPYAQRPAETLELVRFAQTGEVRHTGALSPPILGLEDPC